MPPPLDAVVVGSGPNGLAAAIALACAGRSVRILEAADAPGGAMRSAALTLPGFVHDSGSAVHPMAVASPFFRQLPLADFGLEWVQPPAPFAHPLDGQPAVLSERDVDATADGLDPADAAAYRRLYAPLVRRAEDLFADLLGPVGIPRHPILAARFGLNAVRSARGLARAKFSGERARALFAGLGVHSVLPLEQSPGAAAALMLGVAGHAVGWPFPRGGAQKLADALVAYAKSLGVEIECGRRVAAWGDLPDARAVVFDLTPRQVLGIVGDRFPARYARRLRGYRYGPGIFKVDWALSGPVPWRDPAVGRAATVHVGGTLDEIADAERAVFAGGHPERPFVLLTQPSLFDSSRAPAGRQTLWAYCHVPNGSTVDMTERIEAQIERFAPGFRDTILARHATDTAALERWNANCVGGDITGGALTWGQIFPRPAWRLDPYSTPLPGVFFGSASTPPGGGVHGMGGYHAARSVLRRG